MRVTILGVPFLPLREEEVRERMARLCRETGAAGVFTPNPELLLSAQKDPSFLGLLRSADLLLPDGVGVLLAARLRGTPLPQRITGIDTAEWLLSYAAAQGLSVFLLGGREGVAREAAERLMRRWEGLRICGVHHGYFDKAANSPDQKAILRLLREAKPDLLFVCLGSPAQERWIGENAHRIPSLRLAMGLGGCLDVWSGRVRRAPKAFRAIGCEWLWRALREPTRIPRLLALPRFLWAALRDRPR